jgi:hypothetical protein
LVSITEAVKTQFIESNEDMPTVHSIMIGDDRRVDLFKHACDACISVPEYELPAGIEVFIVPNHIAYIAVNTPIDSEEGFPIPLGILTFDHASVNKIQRFLATILASRSAIESHCTWQPKGLLEEVRNWLSATRPPNATGGG